MALSKAMGWDNPFTKFVGNNRNSLMGFGAGLAGGRNFGQGVAAGLDGLQRGAMADDIAQQQQEAEAERAEQINATAQFLRSKGAEDLAAAVEGGMTTGADAFNSWYSAQNAQPEAFTLGEGDIRYDGMGNVIAQGAPGGSDPTSAMQEYDFARGQGYQGDFTTWKTDVARAGASNIDFNNSQALAGGYADRMANANSILDDPKITAAQVDPMQAGMGAIPGVGNFMTSNERKLAEQAQRDFVNAILRRESGAAIAESEFQNAARQYFPQPGDTPDVIEQKRRNREIAIQGVSRAAGPAYQQPTVTPPGVVPYTEFFQ